MKTRVVLSLCLLAGCSKDDSAPPIPEGLRGAFGRTADDTLHGTNGLVISADSLALSQMKITIKAGKVIGDDYQVDLAEVRWEKDGDKVPTKCKGTIARDEERLFLRLFELNSDKPCESILEGEWNAWSEVTQFPAAMHGWFGSAWAYSEVNGVLLTDTAAVSTGGAVFDLVSALQWDGREDEVIVLKGTYGNGDCRGTITLKDDRLRSSLETIEDESSCGPRIYGERWTIDDAKLPKAPISNGKVEIAITGHDLKITSKGQAKVLCEQRIVRTKGRATTDRSRDGIPVLSGVILALEPGELQGDTKACNDALKAFDTTLCEARLGVACDPQLATVLAGGEAPMHCPSHIVLGDTEQEGRRVSFLPRQDPTHMVCFETVERFK